MLPLARRDFLSMSLAAALQPARSPAIADEILANPRKGVEKFERGRVLAAGARYLHARPQTIVSVPAPRSPGGPHDYYSEADYFWPNPDNPSGPYINRDGESNPQNFNSHRELLIRLSIVVPSLVAAWLLTGRRALADRAAEHLRAWFVAPETRMNPDLQFAQAVHGVNTGRSFGIIDTLHLAEVAQAVIVLHSGSALSDPDWHDIRAWFAQYLMWMQTSEPGEKERDAKNNHGTCWIVQAAAFGRLTGDRSALEACSERLKHTVFPEQIASDGSFPLELARTKPYGYCLFNLDALGMAAEILSDPSDNLWQFRFGDGRNLASSFAFMAPFLAEKQRWPYRHDVQYFEDLPVRQPSLLFAGIAYRKREYVDLWCRLDPDPTVAEVIRNHPIRQPLLWMHS